MKMPRPPAKTQPPANPQSAGKPQPAAKLQPASLPTSATHAVVAWIGVGVMLGAVTVMNFWPPFEDIAYLALTVMACTALGIFIPDLLWQKVQRRSLTSLSEGDWSRTFT